MREGALVHRLTLPSVADQESHYEEVRIDNLGFGSRQRSGDRTDTIRVAATVGEDGYMEA